MSSVVYLYGFVPSGTSAPGPSLPGLDGSAVHVLELGPFAAAVSVMDAREYGEGTVESRLKDLAWVGSQGARHETVVTWFADHAAILPARLLTVFSSEDALRAEAVRRTDSILEAIERFRELREWDLKVSFDSESLSAHLGELSREIAALDAEIQSAPPGRRYLLERRRADLARAEAGGVARRLAQDLLSKLSHFAEEVSELDRPPVRDEVPVVLNAALLVHRGRARELESTAAPAVADLRALGVHATLTGPWAPYRFTGAQYTGSRSEGDEARV
jgi:hypothetical protein